MINTLYHASYGISRIFLGGIFYGKKIKINHQELSIKEYMGNRVVTFKDIDTVHGRVEGTAHRNFKHNKRHLIEGVDYYKLQMDEIRPFGIKSPNGGIVVTESGYLMLVKSFMLNIFAGLFYFSEKN